MSLLPEILPALLRGAWFTIILTVSVEVLALIVGFAAGLARLSPYWIVRAPVAVYVEVFRTTSSLVQIYYFFFVLPLLGLNLGAFQTGVLVLSLNFGAYLSEIVRSSILAVDKGQWDAATALNMGRLHKFRRIIVPQAIPMMLPGFGNYLLELLKATSLVSLITITELTFTGSQLVQYYGQPTPIYLSVFFMYLLLAIPLVLFSRYCEHRFQRR